MFKRNVLGALLSVLLIGAFATPAFAEGGHSGSASIGSSATTTQKEHQKAESEHSALRGTITAVSATSITINGQAAPLGQDVVVRFHDKVVAVSAIPTGVDAVVKLDSAGNAVKIELLQDNNIPKGDSYVGVIGAVYGSSVTIGQYTLTFAPGVRVKYGDRSLAVGAIPSGVKAKVSLDKNNLVTQLKLFSDPSIPKGESARGTISAVSATSITIGQYTLALSDSTEVKYHDFRLSVSQIPTGVEAKVEVGKDLTVTQVKLYADPNLPTSKSLRGTVSAVGPETITVGGYTLNVDPNAVIEYKGTAYSLASIQTGWDVKLHLDSTGTVVEVKIKQGPQSQTSQGS